MTSDGISTRDWNRVRALATKVANTAEDSPAEVRLTKQLHELIDNLATKYGELPSLLATKADYLEDASERLKLLSRAYRVAERRADKPNLTFVSSSIAQLCIEELRDLRQGGAWLRKLEEHLGQWWDDSEAKELVRLGRIAGRKIRLTRTAPSTRKLPRL